MAILKNTYESIEQVPEGLESYYTEKDGKYVIEGVEGFTEKSRLDEFRENNINLRQTVETKEEEMARISAEVDEIRAAKKALEEKYAGIDLDEWSETQKKLKEAQEKDLIEKGEVDTLIQSRIEEVLSVKQKEIDELRNSNETKVNELQSSLESYDSQLNKLLIDNEITKVSAAKGVKSSAMEDVIARSRGTFKVEDGKVVAYNAEGRVMYADDAVTPLSIEGWISGLSESAPHLFETSQGSGSDHNGGSDNGGAPASNQNLSPEDMIKQGLSSL